MPQPERKKQDKRISDAENLPWFRHAWKLESLHPFISKELLTILFYRRRAMFFTHWKQMPVCAFFLSPPQTIFLPNRKWLLFCLVLASSITLVLSLSFWKSSGGARILNLPASCQPIQLDSDTLHSERSHALKNYSTAWVGCSSLADWCHNHKQSSSYSSSPVHAQREGILLSLSPPYSGTSCLSYLLVQCCLMTESTAHE